MPLNFLFKPVLKVKMAPSFRHIAIQQ